MSRRVCPSGHGMNRSASADDRTERRCDRCGTVGRLDRTLHACCMPACCGVKTCSACLHPGVYACALELAVQGAVAVPAVRARALASLERGEGATLPSHNCLGAHLGDSCSSWAWTGGSTFTVLLEGDDWAHAPYEVELHLGDGARGTALLVRSSHIAPAACVGGPHRCMAATISPVLLRRLRADFVSDLTVPDGSRVPAGSTFVKAWHLSQGTGPRWERTLGQLPSIVRDDVDSESFRCTRYVGTRDLPGSIRPLGLSGAVDVEARVEIVAPLEVGHYRVYFRVVCTGTLCGFGDRLWVDFVAE